MNSKNVARLFIFVFCLSIVMFCQPATNEKPSTQNKDVFDAALRVSDDVKDLFKERDAKKNLRTAIMIEFKEKLEDDFKENYFSEMGDLLRDQHAILEDAEKDYGRVKAKDQFHRLFKKAKEKKQNEHPDKKIVLSIKIKHITVDKIVDPREVEGDTPDEKAVDMIARVIFTYHIKLEDGSFAENQGGGGSGEFLHRRICNWH